MGEEFFHRKIRISSITKSTAVFESFKILFEKLGTIQAYWKIFSKFYLQERIFPKNPLGISVKSYLGKKFSFQHEITL